MKRKEMYEKNLKNLEDYFDKNYPNWREDKYIVDKLKKTARKMSENILQKKTKTILKEDYQGDWPFTSDKIILVQTSKKMISVIIDFKEYALNSLAASGLKLDFAHDRGKAVQGKSVSAFIEMGMKL